MGIPESLNQAAIRAACDDEIMYIAVWEGSGITGEGIRPLLMAAPGVCAVSVRSGDSQYIRPFVWTADLTDDAARLAQAIYELGVTENLVEAATALSEDGGI